jgi:hypothetical protein
MVSLSVSSFNIQTHIESHIPNKWKNYLHDFKVSTFIHFETLHWIVLLLFQLHKFSLLSCWYWWWQSLQGVPTRTHIAEVRFEVSAVVTKKITVFWDLKQYLPAHCQYLEWTFCLHLPFWWRQQFFQNVGNDLPDHIAATHKTVLFTKPTVILHTFIIMPIYLSSVSSFLFYFCGELFIQ